MQKRNSKVARITLRARILNSATTVGVRRPGLGGAAAPPEVQGARRSSIVLIKPRKSASALAKRVSLAKFVSFDGLGSGISF